MKQIEVTVVIQFDGKAAPDQKLVKIIEARVYDFLQAKGVEVKDVQALIVDGPRKVNLVLTKEAIQHTNWPSSKPPIQEPTSWSDNN